MSVSEYMDLLETLYAIIVFCRQVGAVAMVIFADVCHFLWDWGIYLFLGWIVCGVIAAASEDSKKSE